jgi:hypothetical protein
VKRMLKRSAAINYVYERYLVDKSSSLGAGDREVLADLSQDNVRHLRGLVGHDIEQWGHFRS